MQKIPLDEQMMNIKCGVPNQEKTFAYFLYELYNMPIPYFLDREIKRIGKDLEQALDACRFTDSQFSNGYYKDLVRKTAMLYNSSNEVEHERGKTALLALGRLFVNISDRPWSHLFGGLNLE